MKTSLIVAPNKGIQPLEANELLRITGGAEPAEGSYAAGYAIGKWFNEMFHIWHYGLTHLSDR